MSHQRSSRTPPRRLHDSYDLSCSRRALNLRLELPQIPVVPPCRNFPVTQFENAHTRYAYCLIPNYEVIDSLRHHKVAVGYDVTNFPRQGLHLPGTSAERLLDVLNTSNWLPRCIPPSCVLREVICEFVGIGSHT